MVYYLATEVNGKVYSTDISATSKVHVGCTISDKRARVVWIINDVHNTAVSQY